MGRVSKRIVNKEFCKEIDAQLQNIITSLSNKEEVELFLKEFLTGEEKIMLGKRLILYMLLNKGYSNTQIHDGLSMSHETIRCYKGIFSTKSLSFKKQIAKLIRHKKTKDFWDKIEKILIPVTLAFEMKTNMKSRSKLLNRDY